MKTSVKSVIFYWFPLAYQFFVYNSTFFLLVLLEQEEETLT